MIEITAQLRNLRIAPRKVRLVADAVRGLTVEDALVQLQFMQKVSAPIVAKLIESAVANARHNSGLSQDALMIKGITVDEAIAMKRWRPAAFGAAHPLKRRGSHVRLVLGLKPGVTPAVPDTDKKLAEKVETQQVKTLDEARAAASRKHDHDHASKGTKVRSGETSHAQKRITRTTSK